MPNPNATPTPITPPRVPLIDSRTGLIDRAWYMFFLSLMNAAMLVYEGDVSPSSESLLASYDAALQALAQNVNTQPLPVDLSAELTKQIEAAGLTDYATNLLSQIAEMQKQLEALNIVPSPTQGTVVAVTGTAPVMSTGGIAPNISMAASNTSTDGYLTSTDWNTFNNKGSGSVTSVAISGGTTGLTTFGGPITTSGTITFAGTLAVANGGTGVVTLTGLAKGNGTSAFTAATAGTDYVAPGGALGTPSSGIVTNLTGTANITVTGGASGAIAATTLSASSTVSGTGFSTYLASPPAIGGTAPAAVSATALSYTTTLTGGTGIVNLGSGQFYKDASGNVGIGTTGPTYPLHVNGTGLVSGLIINGGGTYTAGSIYSDSSWGMLFRAKQASPSQADFAWTNSANVERMRIDASGNVGIGTTANASAILDAQSTTKGVRMPNMTTTQKNAIASPAAGLMIFDTTLAKLCVYNGSAWQTVTSV